MSRANTRAPTRPNSSAPVMRMPTVESGAAAAARAATTPVPLSRAPCERPLRRPASRQEAGQDRQHRSRHRPAPARAVLRAGPSASAVSATTASPTTQTATSRPAMEWPWALESRCATTHRRGGCAPRVAIRLASSRRPSPRCTHPSPTPIATMASARSPVIQTARAAQGGRLPEERKGNSTRARPPSPAPKMGNARRLDGAKVKLCEITV